MISLIDKLTELLVQKFQEEEFNHLFLVELKQLPSNTIEVFLDSDKAVQYDHCTKISRYLETHLDENGWLGDSYTLDVSSAGVGAPLKLKRQYIKNIGREISVELLNDHKNAKGILTEVKDESIVIEYQEKIKLEGRKKKELILIKKEIPFENIKNTIVTISFK